MNANTIITEDMTLTEKLEAIDKAMLEAQFKHREEFPDAPLDPSTLLTCESCEG
jgi:hypothetical protein